MAELMEQEVATAEPPKRYKVSQQSLADFASTISAKPNLTPKEIFSKFPEFKNDQSMLQSAMDYYSTSKSGKYKTVDELNSKFPEFEFEKKSPSENGVPTSANYSRASTSHLAGDIDVKKAAADFEVDRHFGFKTGRELAAGQTQSVDNTAAVQPLQTIKAQDDTAQKEIRAQAKADKAEQIRKATPKAIENAAKKSLKIKGLNSNNSALLNAEKNKFTKEVEEGNSSVAFGKDGEVGLVTHPGFLKSFYDHMAADIDNRKNARAFAKMDVPERVAFANKLQSEQQPTPYIGEKPTDLGSVGAMAGGLTPTLGLYGAGALAGGVLESAAPVTGGLSNLALKPVMSFALNEGDGANQKGMQGTLERYNAIKKENPNIDDIVAMADAAKGEDVDRLAGIAETALFSQVGTGGLGKSVTGKVLKGIASGGEKGLPVFGKRAAQQFVKGGVEAGLDIGEKTAITEGLRDLGHNAEGVENKSGTDIIKDMATAFADNAPMGVLLHATMGAIGGIGKVPNLVKSALKYDTVTKLSPEQVHAELNKNVESGAITPEQATQAEAELNQFSEAVKKVPDDLVDDAKASVAGLMIKRDNILAGAEAKDKTAQDLIKQQADAIDNQIKEIYRTGKPLEHEVNEITGDTYKQPTFDDVAKERVESLADKIAAGKRITEPEDLQTQQNFSGELEKELQRRVKQEKSEQKDKESPKTDVADNVEKFLPKPKEPLERAKDLVNSDVVKGFSAEPLKDAANNNPEEFKGFLKEISEQSQDENSRSRTIETYGKELVDIADQMFPKSYAAIAEHPLESSVKKDGDVNLSDEGQVRDVFKEQQRKLFNGELLDNEGNDISINGTGIQANGLEKLTDKKWGHGSDRATAKDSIKILEDLFSGGKMKGDFGYVYKTGEESMGYNARENGKFVITTDKPESIFGNALEGTSGSGVLNPKEVEIILNNELSPFGQTLKNKHPDFVIKDYNGKEFKTTTTEPTVKQEVGNDIVKSENEGEAKNETPIINITSTKGGYEGDFLNDYDFLADGSEHAVYRSKDGKSVIKVGEPYNSNDTYNARVNDALQIDKLLGDGSLKVIGNYKSKNGTLNPVYSQRFVEGKALTETEVESYLESKGFKKEGQGYVINDNGKSYKITDLSDNFIRQKDGNVSAVDAGIQEVTFNDTYNEIQSTNADQQKTNSVVEKTSINEPATTVIQPEEVKKPNIVEAEPAQEGGGITVQQPPTSINYKGVAKIATEFGTEARTPTERKSDLETIKEADNLVKDGWTPKDALSKIEGGDTFISDAEYVNMTRYAAELSQRLRDTKVTDPEYDKTLAELNRVSKASSLAGQAQGRALGIRGRFKTVQEGTYENFMLEEVAANNEAKLTTQQKETANAEYEQLKKSQGEVNANLERIRQKEAELDAQIALAKSNKSRNKTPKSKDDFVKERQSLKEKLKKQFDDYVAQSRNMGIVADDGTKSFKMTVDMAKTVGEIIKSHVDETVYKLEDIVKRTLDDIKDAGVEGMERKDVIDVLAGVYNEKKPAKSAVMRIREDLRVEAKLINRLDALINAGETKNEKVNIQRNQEIHDLRKKIKDYQKEVAGADKFYTEEIDTDTKALQTLINKNKKATADIQAKIDKGDYSEDVKKLPTFQNKELQKKFPNLYKDALRSRDELIKIKRDIELRRLKQQYLNRSPQQKFEGKLVQALNVPRTLMASMDFSAPLRQGLVASSAHPILAARASKFMFEAAKNENVYNRWLDDVHKSERWDWAEKSKLAITDPATLHLRDKEEAFLGSNLAEQIPVVGGLVKGSERAYVGFLNKVRWDLFNQYADAFEAQGKTLENNPELYKGLASFVNASTGRGGMAFGEAASPLMSSILFSPRLIASRMNMLGLTDVPNLVVRGLTLGKRGLNYGFYKNLPPEVRMLAAKDMLRFLVVGTTTLAIAKMAFGAEVEDDPKSSDFGKIKSGNTRWDIWGGFQPYARIFAQLLAGERKSANTGKMYSLEGNGAFGKDRLDVLGSFARGKLAPVPAMVVDIIAGRKITGDKVNRQFDIPFYDKDNPQEGITVTDEILEHVAPLLIQDIFKAGQDKGMGAVFSVGLPSIFGVGVQTYDPKVNKGGSSGKYPSLPKMPSMPKMPTMK